MAKIFFQAPHREIADGMLDPEAYLADPFYAQYIAVMNLFIVLLLLILRNEVLCATLGCISKSNPSTACCSGEIELDSSLTSIASNAFYSCKNLSGSIVIPNGVITIGEQAFRDCTGLNGTLTIADSVETIGHRAFAWSYNLIGNLILPRSLKVIDVNAFRGMRLDGNLVIPNGVQIIGDGAFRYSDRLRGDLVIPSSVATIGSYAFSSGFTSITIYSTTTVKNDTFLESVSPRIIDPPKRAKYVLRSNIADVGTKITNALKSVQTKLRTVMRKVRNSISPNAYKNEL